MARGGYAPAPSVYTAKRLTIIDVDEIGGKFHIVRPEEGHCTDEGAM